jgi:hypothetical protein
MKPPRARLPAGKAGRLGVSLTFPSLFGRTGGRFIYVTALPDPPAGGSGGGSSPSTEARGIRLAVDVIKFFGGQAFINIGYYYNRDCKQKPFHADVFQSKTKLISLHISIILQRLIAVTS